MQRRQARCESIAVREKGAFRRTVVLGAAALATVAALCVVGFSTTSAGAAGVFSSVSATVETAPVPNSGDAADDPAVWINQSNPARSAVIGTDKQGGLAVYDLFGRQIQYLRTGDMNNVDVKTDFMLGGKPVPLVTSENRSNNSIGIYKMNPDTRQLQNVAARVVKPGIEVYGSCMYKSASGKFYTFINSKAGVVEQWELFENSGKVDARKVRSFDVGSQTEGCVADKYSGAFYVAEEDRGIWKYGAEPGDGTRRTLVDSVGSTGNLTADVEGLTIAYGENGTGQLIASSQGNSSYVVYERADGNDYVKSFKIASAGGIDGTSQTDGIDVAAANLGARFPGGVFVVQDGKNEGGNQNFKLVPYQNILR